MKSILTIATAALALLALAPAGADIAPGSEWNQTPFRLKAGEKLLDTYPADRGGHAAPFLADVDGDGRRDLTVGSIHGQFHFFRNVGTDAAPVFGEKSTFLMAGLSGDERAQVPNFCCVAAGPQLLDVDGDGVLDLTSGSYHPGSVYWFKGRGDGNFHTRQMLMDSSGRPVLPRTEKNPYVQGEGASNNYMTNVAWADWDNNGASDLILGNNKGQLFVRLNVRGVMSGTSSMPTATQPQFMLKEFQKFNEIQIQGGNAIPERHAAPAVADWDGDGLWDILVGAESGRVYFLKNTGKPGAPVFNRREELIGPGVADQWVQPGKDPERGVRAQIQAVDFNLDGKMDLLVGEWAAIRSIRADITGAERRDLDRIFREIKVLDDKVGYDGGFHPRYIFPGYSNAEATLASVHSLEKEMAKYLVRFDPQEVDDYMQLLAYEREMGLVSVYLRK